MLCILLPAGARSDALERGLELFRANQLADALPYLEDAASRDGAGPDAAAWLAEAYRRLDRRREADSTARVALSLSPCHAFAHGVLGSNFDDRFGDWAWADPDSSWTHLLRAVVCDSTDGNVWLSVLTGALERGDRALERRGYRRLLGDGFFVRPVLNYARWILARLPEHSMLLVNGDMDTYPCMALQEVEGLRTDVAIINIALLNADWYRRVVRDRFGIPMPFAAEALDRLEWGYDDQGQWSGPPSALERGWREMLRKGLLTRPLAYSTSVDMKDLPDSTRRLVFEGAWFRALPWTTDSDVDTAEVRRSIGNLRPEDFAGAWTSARDRSPVRVTSTHKLMANIANAGIKYAAACLPEHPDRALAMLDWAVAFGRQAGLDARLQEPLEEYRDAIASRVPAR